MKQILQMKIPLQFYGLNLLMTCFLYFFFFQERHSELVVRGDSWYSLKKRAKNFKSRKSKTSTSQQMEDFIERVPNDTICTYLAFEVRKLKINFLVLFLNKNYNTRTVFSQVRIIFGTKGTCRTSKSVNVQIQNVECHESMFLIDIPETTKILKYNRLCWSSRFQNQFTGTFRNSYSRISIQHSKSRLIISKRPSGRIFPRMKCPNYFGEKIVSQVNIIRAFGISLSWNFNSFLSDALPTLRTHTSQIISLKSKNKEHGAKSSVNLQHQ